MIKKNFLGLIAILYFLQITPLYAKKGFDVEQAIKNGDHQKLTEYYRNQAKEQREIAALHVRMSDNYRGTHAHRDRSEMIKHCKILREKALQSAEKYEAMSKLEELQMNFDVNSKIDGK